MGKRTLILAAVATLLLGACNAVSNLIHDDEAVASIGKEKLFLSELESYIPEGVSPEDSAGLARQYINSWAMDRLFVQIAEKQLSGSELNVDRELEDYRRSLLRFRYEQSYVNSKLDTLITPAQLTEYYETHEEELQLARPILKVRFIDIISDSPNYKEIMKKLPATGGRDLADLDSLAYLSALRYYDASGEWKDAAVLAREFSTDYETMLRQLRNNVIEFKYEQTGNTRAAYVFDIRRSGTAPLEFCAASINDIILSARKRELLKNLEQDLLTNALENNDFVIYGDKD